MTVLKVRKIMELNGRATKCIIIIIIINTTTDAYQATVVPYHTNIVCNNAPLSNDITYIIIRYIIISRII